ncbi:MAG: hypothetical protein DLM73_00215 [Chthoniobacterales bacterium]|nr:MAG: hypothetical protein DLM73_00215 [Chthoniobacterales bacterium]
MSRYRHFLRASVILVIGTGLGLAVGWLIFSVSSLTGKALFITEGGLIGLVVSALFVAYTRRSDVLTLSEITINVPEFAEMKFAVNSEYRQVAWKLFIETLTRVATQPLDTEAGSLREALSSLYKLFSETRELLKDMRPSKPTTGVTVEVFAVKMLNQEIRPFLSKWHVELKAFELTHRDRPDVYWDQNPDCRKELEALRSRLISYAKAFGELAGLKNTERFFALDRPMSK